ncbi:MAG: helix-turn-helix transcriptional regulator [Bacteroidetes bacterium]|nr:helix-turn-helix transcriptional regulator [Bacteroidota bacterium]
MRLQKGWSLKETAQRIGVSVETVCTYQRGTTPNFKYLTKIAKAFDISLEQLITGSDEKMKPLVHDFNWFKKYYSYTTRVEKIKIRQFIEAAEKRKK